MASPSKTNAENRAGIVDRYGELDLRIQQFSPFVAEHKALKAQILGWYESHPADQPAIAKGGKFTIQLSARQNERTITKPQKAFALLKAAAGSLAAAIAAVKIPLAAVDRFIPAPQHGQFLVEERSGARSLKCVPNEI